MLQPARSLFTLCIAICFPAAAFGQSAEDFRKPYAGDDATGQHVLGLWQFADGHELEDSSGNGHDLSLQGATVVAGGLFGKALKSAAGWPREDSRHSAVAKDHDSLSPAGPFTAEMWVLPSAEMKDYPEAFLLDKKYVAHDDYQWTMTKADGKGHRRMKVLLGFGEESATFWSVQAAPLATDEWIHLAFTYDAAGTVTFWADGQNLGSSHQPGLGAIHPGRHVLSIGDRVGSLYHGFPGLIDQVRLCSGVREFRPGTIEPIAARRAYLRMEKVSPLKFRVRNLQKSALKDATVQISVDSIAAKNFQLPEIAAGASHNVEYLLDTSLRSGDYSVVTTLQLQQGETKYRSSEQLPITIVPRSLPGRMPVVMWGGFGSETLPKVKDLGFTHFLGLHPDYAGVWKAKKPIVAEESKRSSDRNLLDAALEQDLRVLAQMAPGRWLESQEDLLRIDRDGGHYSRENISASAPGIQEFGYNVGASMAQTWHDHPAFAGALINTEIRDGTQVSFHPHETAAFKQASGFDVPDVVQHKAGVSWIKLENFPKDRIIPDDDPVRVFYEWFWKQGDGWNDFNSAISDGVKSTDRKDVWTFFDPAVRVPSIWGSGGVVDYISHWTYSYPDPIRIGLTTDELFAMAAGSRSPQQVMKMTQVIWYRSQTAPPEKPAAADNAAAAEKEQAPWEDFDPGAQYITIAPMHLREAFWTKISRPIQGIMYHGWGSLTETDGTSAYRFTHPETQNELRRLVHDVVEPLGPALKQIGADQTDVALLESFTSQMFATRGTWGWGHRWTGDAWHIAKYAQLQPQIVYEETVNRDGLDDFKVLIMPSCDVLPESVAAKVKAFQQRGGIIVADERLAPGIKADIVIPVYLRTKKADVDKAALQRLAADLRTKLDSRYQRRVDSSSPEVLTHTRRHGSTDYVFVMNDHREFGDYVGHHGRVMERGLPSESTITLGRKARYVYDLINHRTVRADTKGGGQTSWNVALGPADGGIYMLTDQAVKDIALKLPEDAKSGTGVSISLSVTDESGKPVDAVIPVQVAISDPDGRPAEFSGYYAAVDGQRTIQLDLATNETRGVWEVTVRELASGLVKSGWFRVK